MSLHRALARRRLGGTGPMVSRAGALAELSNNRERCSSHQNGGPEPGVLPLSNQARATGAALLWLAALLRRMLAAALLRRMLACLLALALGVGVGQTIDASPVVGHCGPTSPGECGGSRESGSWHTRRERIRSLEQCAERCRACPSCSFVSYSKVKATSPHLAARTLTSTAWRRNPHPAPP